jgi:hypothetical protein
MKVIRRKGEDAFVISVNRIDWMSIEDGSGGRSLIKIGTGGITHHFDCDTKEKAIILYDEITEAIEKL